VESPTGTFIVLHALADADSSDFGLGEQSSQKMGASLPGTPMNRRAKFDAASFILGGEIRNCTNKQTKLQTVNDISTPCLSACVENYCQLYCFCRIVNSTNGVFRQAVMLASFKK